MFHAFELPFKLQLMVDESDTDDYIERTMEKILVTFKVEEQPEYARGDAKDIIDELRDDLGECKENLQQHHSMFEFKSCAHQQIEDARDRIWQYYKSLVPSSGSSSLAFCLVLILFGFVSTML